MFEKVYSEYGKFLFDIDRKKFAKPINTVTKANSSDFVTHGSTLIAEFWPKLSEVLTDQIELCKYMTNNRIGQIKKISTAPFLKAVRVMVERVFNHIHDDYNYKSEMNEILPVKIKTLIKLCVKRPWEIDKELYSSLPKLFSYDEIIHILVLAIHKKMEMELFYVTSALSKFL